MLNIKICIWDWGSYNEGVGNWCWFSLPEEITELEEHLCDLEAEGLEEPFICDTDGWSDVINEYTGINNLLEVMADLDGLNKYDILEMYHEQYNHEDAIYPFDNDHLSMLCGEDMEDFANRIHFGDYNAYDSYFYLNGYGNIVTVSEKEKEAMEDGYIKDYIADILSGHITI